MKKIFIIAEIGINHNGDIEIAKKLISSLKQSGADAVKFQKRTVEDVYTQEQLNSLRDSPWGKTFRQQKEGLEFNEKQYDLINDFCKIQKISWFASCWDIKSLEFLKKYNLKFNKIASAMLTHKKLISEIAEEKKYTFISTGMHSLNEIDEVVNLFVKKKCPFELMHTVSTYPTKNENANLKMIETLRKRYKCNVGYSGHENGRAVTVGAAALGATSIERHVTLDRTMYGSDQAASLEIDGFRQMVNYVRIIEKALGSGEKIILDDEKKIREKLKPINI